MTFEPDKTSNVTPPTTSGDLRELEPPQTWPTVIGVFGIIFASLGILGGICGVLWPLLMGTVVNMVPAEDRDEVTAQMQASMPYPALQMGVYALETACAVVLLIGSIKLLGRRRVAVPLLKGYAWADLITNLIGSGIGIIALLAQVEAMKQTPPPTGAPGAAVGTAFGLGSVIVMFLLTCVWPAFLLIWFGRSRIREAVAGWDGQPSDVF